MVCGTFPSRSNRQRPQSASTCFEILPWRKQLHTVEPIRWTSEGVVLLDQRRLPSEVIHHTYTDYRELAKAIKDMVIRGAPAIGVAAAMGIALAVQQSKAKSLNELRAEFLVICETFAHTRPTAVDLFWAIERFKLRFEELARTSSKDEAAAWNQFRTDRLKKALKAHEERRKATKASDASAPNSCP